MKGTPETGRKVLSRLGQTQHNLDRAHGSGDGWIPGLTDQVEPKAHRPGGSQD